MLEKSNKPLDVIESPKNRISNDMRKRIAESQYIPEFKTDYVWDKNYDDGFKTIKTIDETVGNCHSGLFIYAEPNLTTINKFSDFL
jgi:hypothetical protein